MRLDASLMLIGPFMGHDSCKLVFWGRGVGTCPHEVGLYSDRRPAFFAGLQGQAL